MLRDAYNFKELKHRSTRIKIMKLTNELNEQFNKNIDCNINSIISKLPEHKILFT